MPALIASIRLTALPTSDVLRDKSLLELMGTDLYFLSRFSPRYIIIFYWVSVRQNVIGATYFSQFLPGWTCHLTQKF